MESDNKSYGDKSYGDKSYGDRGGNKNFSKKRKSRRPSFRRKRPPVDLTFDYKQVHTLSDFITEEGKIIPGRVSGLSASQQRGLTLAVKRARKVAFLSATSRYTIS